MNRARFPCGGGAESNRSAEGQQCERAAPWLAAAAADLFCRVNHGLVVHSEEIRVADPRQLICLLAGVSNLCTTQPGSSSESTAWTGWHRKGAAAQSVAATDLGPHDLADVLDHLDVSSQCGAHRPAANAVRTSRQGDSD